MPWCSRSRPRNAQPRRRSPSGVAGFNLTLSAAKSGSMAWTPADGGTAGLIYDAHQQALAYVVRYAEQCLITSRSGKDGVVQEGICGVVVAAFDPWEARAGDRKCMRA
ncbi:MAG: relaxase domain-containing protein [Actinomycetota bacterium]